MKGRISYLCLEGIVEGQGPFTHVNEIVAGLRDRGWEVELFASTTPLKRTPGSVLGNYFRLQARMALRLYRSDMIYVRSHFAALPIVLLARLLCVPVAQEVNGTFEDCTKAH